MSLENRNSGLAKLLNVMGVAVTRMVRTSELCICYQRELLTDLFLFQEKEDSQMDQTHLEDA